MIPLRYIGITGGLSEEGVLLVKLVGRRLEEDRIFGFGRIQMAELAFSAQRNFGEVQMWSGLTAPEL